MFDLLPSIENTEHKLTHPEVEEDAKEGEGAKKAAGQSSHQPGLVLG